MGKLQFIDWRKIKKLKRKYYTIDDEIDIAIFKNKFSCNEKYKNVDMVSSKLNLKTYYADVLFCFISTRKGDTYYYSACDHMMALYGFKVLYTASIMFKTKSEMMKWKLRN